MKIWNEISFDGDDACIETSRKDPTTGSLRVEARVSIVKERDSLPAGRQGYELQQRFPVFLPTDITHLILFPFD
jgi:hypothetical protein